MKELNKLLQEGKFLCDYDAVKDEKLTQYSTLLSDDIFWQSRKKYFQILEFFISKSITLKEFIQ
jgi:hypothetical protein